MIRPIGIFAAALACGLAATVSAGCGSSKPGLTASASSQLQAQVQAIRNAATAGDPSGAAAGLARLRSEVSQLESKGEISSSRSAAILTAASGVQSQLAAIPTTTTSTTSTTTTLPPTTPAPTTRPQPDHHGPPAPAPAPAPPGHGDKGPGGHG